MGQGDSKEDAKMKAMVSKLNKMELEDIEAVFMELASKTDEGESVIKQPTWLNRDKFAEILGTNEFIIEQLFTAFDKDGNGLISLQEFVTGMAICLHGSIKKKCDLLFKIFNLDDDEGIDPKELALVLTNCMQSAQSLLRKTSRSEGICNEDDDFEDQAGNALVTSVLVDKIVKDAFEKCDVSHTGKLEINEFANWVHKNPKLVNNVFVMQCPKPSSAGQCNPSFIIGDEDEEEDIERETSEKPCIENETEKDDCISDSELAAPLSLGSDKDLSTKPTTLKELFSQSSEPDVSNFFDTIGNNQQNNDVLNKQFFNADHTDNESGHRRTQSEVFGEKHFDILNEVHSGSQVDLNQISADNVHISENYLGTQTASESLYSIALSQDSLYEEKDTRIELPDDFQSLQHGSSGTDISDEILDDDFGKEVPENHYRSFQHSISASETLVDESEVNTPYIADVSTDEIGVECMETSIDNEIRCEIPGDSLGESVKSIGSTSSNGESAGTCFWQPNAQTMQLLKFVADGNLISDHKLIQPHIIVETAMNDPVKELVEKYLGEQEASKRPTPNIDNVDLNEEGLRKLLENGCWRAAIDFTRRYLEAHDARTASVGSKEEPLLNPKVLQVWHVRIALLIRLRMFSSAEMELNAFKDFESPDLYYQCYPHLYPGQEGCMVPFSFRLLHADLPQHNSNPNLTLDRLYSLLTKVKAIHGNLLKGLTEAGEKNEHLTEKDVQDRVKLAEKRIIRIHYSLANCFLGMKEYLLTVKLLEQIIVMEPSREIAILSAIGRVYLQLGDSKTAQKYFKRIGHVAAEDTKSLSMITMNMAFTSLTKGLYKDAYQQFLSALNLDENNLSACNNAAVCLLFMGKVKEASDILETMVCQSPEKSLHEEILLNLTTVYELETSRALQKKHKLLDLVCKHKGDGFNVQCLKLT